MPQAPTLVAPWRSRCAPCSAPARFWFLAPGQIAVVVGDAAMMLTSRVMGILLMALAAEFVVQGIRDSLLK